MIEDAPRLAGHRAQDVAWRVHGAPPQAVSGPRYVGLVTRAIACVIDVAIVNAVAALVAAAAALVISVIPVSNALHDALVAAGGAPVAPKRGVLRVAGLMLAALPLFAGFVPILFNNRRRGLADWMADTVVVRSGGS